MKKNILFLCTENSCRSQMAEGWGRFLKSEKFNCYSAGTKKTSINPNAVIVMQEAGVDISGHESKTTLSLSDIKMDFVFTVCSSAHEKCPFFPGGKIIHVGFEDPSKMGKTDLAAYRRIRDEIKEMVLNIEKYMES